MPITKERVDRYIKAKSKIVEKESVNQQSKFMRQAAIKSRWLLNDTHWDTYLTWIQADVESLDKVIAAARERLEDPAIVNRDEIMKNKIVLLEAKAMKKALEIAISYPSQIVKDNRALNDRKKDLHSDEE